MDSLVPSDGTIPIVYMSPMPAAIPVTLLTEATTPPSTCNGHSISSSLPEGLQQ